MNDNELQISTLDSRSYSIQDEIDNERVPLLQTYHQTRQTSLQILDKFFILVLILILSVGALIGVYLLLTEGHKWKIHKVFTISPQELLKPNRTSSGTPTSKLEPIKFLFFQLNYTNNYSYEYICDYNIKPKLTNQKQETNVLFKFVISTYGDIFKCKEPNSQIMTDYDVITIGVFGDFYDNINVNVVESVKSIVNELVMEKNLKTCTEIGIWGDNKFFIEFVENIQNSVTACKENT